MTMNFRIVQRAVEFSEVVVETERTLETLDAC